MINFLHDASKATAEREADRAGVIATDTEATATAAAGNAAGQADELSVAAEPVAMPGDAISAASHGAAERAGSVNALNLENAANLVLADAVSAETGIRGYGGTRDLLFLAPYNLALTRLGGAQIIAGSGRHRRGRPPATGGGRHHGEGAVPASTAKIRCQPRHPSREPHCAAEE